MRVKLVVTRHGETTNNVSNIINGHKDSPLTAAGIQETLAAAPYIQSCDFTWVYVSDLGRTRETLYHLGLAGLVERRLRDRNFGRWNGLPYGLYAKEKAVVLERTGEVEREPAGVESYPELTGRIRGAILDTVEKACQLEGVVSEVRVLFVTHCSPTRCSAMVLEPYATAPFPGDLRTQKIPNNSVTEYLITAHDGQIESVELLKFASTKHLLV